MKTFQKECWVMYAAGQYGYKNGVRVIKTGKTWTVLQYEKVKYESDTLADCKVYVGRYC